MRFTLPLAALSLFSVLFAGCSIMPWYDDEDDYGAVDEGPVEIKWVRTGENPLTYFPEGSDVSQTTDAFHGEWLVDHSTGTRYFVPVRGAGAASRRQLADDALSRTSGPSIVGEVFDKTKSIGSSAAEKVSTGFDKITPEFGKKKKEEESDEIEGGPSS